MKDKTKNGYGDENLEDTKPPYKVIKSNTK